MDLAQCEDRGEGEGQVQASNSVDLPASIFSVRLKQLLGITECKSQSWKGNKTGSSVRLSQAQEAVGTAVRSFNKLIKYKCVIHNHRILSGRGSLVIFKLRLNLVVCSGFELFLAKNNGRTTDKWENGIKHRSYQRASELCTCVC